MLEITHKQKMLKLHNLNSNYGITKILQIANAKKILYKKQTPTIVNAKKFYTETNSYNSYRKEILYKKQNRKTRKFFNFLQLLFENCLKKLEKVFIETIEDFPDVWKQSV